jgi:probable F420-dependent oxidoreductase
VAPTLGVIFPQTEIGPDLERVERFVRTAEDVGFQYLVAYDHVLGADTSTRLDWPGPYTLASQFHEPFVFFGYLAALTELELVPGVLILPQRQTALVAKQAAEVDVLTRGKFRLGVGIGWNDVEYDALGVDFTTRATLYEEQVEVLRLLWTQESVTFTGRFHTIDRAGILPMPVQRPIPIWMGGGADRRVLDRIGRLADGWVCNTPPGHGLEEALEVIAAAATAAGRDRADIGLQGIVQPRSAEDVVATLQKQHARWSAAGADYVSISGLNGGRSPDEHIEFLKVAAAALLG